MTGEDVDYQSGPYTVLFPAGKVHEFLHIPVHGDDILEGDESFNVIIIKTSFSPVTIGNPNQIKVSIIDDEGTVRSLTVIIK